MRWKELTSSLEEAASGGEGNPAVSDIVYDSRKVAAGSIYVAVPGFVQDGDLFIGDAVEHGAVGVISRNPQPRCTVPWLQVTDPRKALGELARKLWNLKLYRTCVAGVTGTNGKTTVTHLIRLLLDQLYTRKRVWMFSTVGYCMGTLCREARRTTPESSDIFRMMGTAPRKPAAVVMEVSSHALELNRVAGFSYDLAVWTNLTRDHLDFHHTMNEYYLAKKKLFTEYLKSRGKAIINIDDRWGRKLAGELRGTTTVTYGSADDADVRIVNPRSTWTGSELDVVAGGEMFHVSAPLPGSFNVYNIAAMCAAAAALSVKPARVREALQRLEPVPGRMEPVATGKEFTTIVDYAHTPDALENVLKTVRELTEERVICVFGCGGDRDRAKRPLMAEAVVRWSDEAVVTSDNPRGENPRAIIKEILDGVPLDFPHWVIPDRREAIGKALGIARRGDCVVVAGKGHEDYQEIDGRRHHFSDREVAGELADGIQPRRIRVA